MMQLYADGSYIGGTSERQTCGAGVYFRGFPGRCDEAVTLLELYTTNNATELCAILYVLCVFSGTTTDLTIMTDSEYLLYRVYHQVGREVGVGGMDDCEEQPGRES